MEGIHAASFVERVGFPVLSRQDRSSTASSWPLIGEMRSRSASTEACSVTRARILYAAAATPRWTYAPTSSSGALRGKKLAPVGACASTRSIRNVRQSLRSPSTATRYQRPCVCTMRWGSTVRTVEAPLLSRYEKRSSRRSPSTPATRATGRRSSPSGRPRVGEAHDRRPAARPAGGVDAWARPVRASRGRASRPRRSRPQTLRPQFAGRRPRRSPRRRRAAAAGATRPPRACTRPPCPTWNEPGIRGFGAGRRPAAESARSPRAAAPVRRPSRTRAPGGSREGGGAAPT